MSQTQGQSPIIVFCDGACEPVNPGGTASWGFIIRWMDGKPDSTGSGVVGRGAKMSNNVAEYAGLYAALLEIRERSDNHYGRKVIIKSDSQLLVNQMAGVWRVMNGRYIPWYHKCQKLVGDLAARKIKVTFQWIPREQNMEADALSKSHLTEGNHGKV